MPNLVADVTKWVEQNIGRFHQKRIESLNSLSLSKVLARKNPYLFKAKHILTAEQIVKSLADAHLSSNEETIFGDWMEGLAIFVNNKVYDGWKSGIPGIDLEFDKDGVRYIVTIKSGPNWANSKALQKMLGDFRTAKKTLRTSGSGLNVVAVNGCCYGKDNQPNKLEHLKLCGQRFWQFISGDENLYAEIVEPLGHEARAQNDLFVESYSQMINKFTREFMNDYCLADGSINWAKIVRFNSGQAS